MALTERTECDRIEIVSDIKCLQIRTATIIEKDGAEITRTFHRRTLYPGKFDADKNWKETDLSKEPEEIQRIARAVWTQEVKDLHKSRPPLEFGETPPISSNQLPHDAFQLML